MINSKSDLIKSTKKSAIELYFTGLPILTDSLKVIISAQTRTILDRLTKLLPECNNANTALSLWDESITSEQLQTFVDIVGETKSLLAEVDLNTLYND